MSIDPFALDGVVPPEGTVFQWRMPPEEGEPWPGFMWPVLPNDYSDLPASGDRIEIGGLVLVAVMREAVEEEREEAAFLSRAMIEGMHNNMRDAARNMVSALGSDPESVTLTVTTTYEPFYPEDYE